MKLSLLVFNCIKYVKFLDDSNFTYEAFKQGNFSTSDLDYSRTIENIFSPLNTAIHRLSDKNKIETRSDLLPAMNENGIIDLKDFPAQIKTIVNVFIVDKGTYKHLPFKKLGRDKLLILGHENLNRKDIYIEYREDIKNFTVNDIRSEEKDVDISEFGITNTMCSYIEEFCKGKLYEIIDPNMAAYHNNLAEQYMEGLDEPSTNFNQQNVVNKWSIE